MYPSSCCRFNERSQLLRSTHVSSEIQLLPRVIALAQELISDHEPVTVRPREARSALSPGTHGAEPQRILRT
jgi:hypothetical protein